MQCEHTNLTVTASNDNSLLYKERLRAQRGRKTTIPRNGKAPEYAYPQLKGLK